MPATTLTLRKTYTVHSEATGVDVRAKSRDSAVDLIGICKLYGVPFSVRVKWTMDVDNGRGSEWYQRKWESIMCTRPGYEGL